jgi:6,7-dimethyl-8-ribityllumazine synthase
LREQGFAEHHITVVRIPGAVEIPLLTQRLARSGHYKAVIALGCVIRRETDHYDYVCTQVSNGCQRVALDHGVPVLFGVLTTHNLEQAIARSTGNENSGRAAALAAIEMVHVLDELD